ncbi:hypothetical protein [Pseudomonas viridiflava]|uniref:hypothetical protein n=1 Tax=Pseudomonas viridiflava TaxID=33069 RepID=UPI000F06351C|nr:hypothetical protein [Pseudomonas viridiflava]MDY0936184.1 hypothetical protein [Pseudomonas viridiflava]MDY1014196.1 hypothetical protein [Pseudomonas viridiflava]
MKRKQKHPVRVIESPQTTTASTRPVHPPFWRYDDEPQTAPGLTLGGFAFLIVLLIILPFYALALLVITLAEAIKGIPLTYAQTLTDPVFFTPLMGTALLAAGLLSWCTSSPAVTAFSFDEARQQLTLTQTARVGKPIEMGIPFSDILWIGPYVLSSHHRSGFFQISFIGPRGKPLQRRLGPDLPITEIEFHGDWLKGLIGTRMNDICWLDL